MALAVEPQECDVEGADRVMQHKQGGRARERTLFPNESEWR